MIVLATATVTGPEARANARIIEANQGHRTIELSELWIAPGAPDVRLYLSPRVDGHLDDAATDLGVIPYDTSHHRAPLTPNIDADSSRSVVIYCKVYSVHFGDGALTWDPTPADR